MRRTLYCIVLLGLTLLSSCENENQDVSVKSAPNLLSEAEITDIGVRHNEALASVLKELQKYPDLNKEQKNDES